jgi:hypothetical protein
MASLPSTLATSDSVAELSFEQHNERQYRELELSRLQERAAAMQPGGKYSFRYGYWTCQPYPGYAVVSMVAGHPENNKLRHRLQEIQQALAQRLNNPAKYYLLPVDSFHQTVANTLSAERFERYIAGPGLEAQYPSLVGEAFAALPPSTHPHPLAMKIIGLSIFSGAIGALGIFEDAADYARILDLRRGFYGNASLQALTIRQTRPFIGHITLAYLGDTLSPAEREKLVSTCQLINQSINRQQLYFYLYETELRRYKNLSHFHREAHFPVYRFTG